MNEIDEVRSQRDTCRAENIRLKRENERLTELLDAAKLAIEGEYELRVGVKPTNTSQGNDHGNR
jgi:regulator of replication initiation timing